MKQGLKTLKDTIISENKKENPQEKAKIIEQEKIKIKAQEETNQQKQKEKIEKQQEKESPYKALIKKITEPIIL
ncbi:MAG: hypothetical protein LBP53_06115 [Candidatus Peribacteria bacterium]|nr:hypothetical protein [Candidatus Peribacteria bacterium]